MIEELGKVLSYVFVFVGGRLTSFGDEWVKDYYARKKELRDKLDRPYHLTSDIIAEAQEEGYKHPPSKALKDRSAKVTARIESLGKRNLALDIREFVGYWEQYFDLNEKIATKGLQFQEDFVRQITLRVELDNHADFIMEALASDYVLLPNVGLKLKRIYSSYVSTNLRKVFQVLKYSLKKTFS